jgi:hypothetical protein
MSEATRGDVQVFSFVGLILTPNSEHSTAEQDISRVLGAQEISDCCKPLFSPCYRGPAVCRFVSSVRAGFNGRITAIPETDSDSITIVHSMQQSFLKLFVGRTDLRKCCGLPSTPVIENLGDRRWGFHLYMTRLGFPMNASDFADSTAQPSMLMPS